MRLLLCCLTGEQRRESPQSDVLLVERRGDHHDTKNTNKHTQGWHKGYGELGLELGLAFLGSQSASRRTKLDVAVS